MNTSVPGEAGAEFALDPVRPNPSINGALRVGFTLVHPSPATLELIDVQGRRLVSRAVGSLGAGHHEVDLGQDRRLPPGVYLVRLRQVASSRTTRVAVIE